MFQEKSFFTTYYSDNIWLILIFPITIICFLLLISIVKWATFSQISKNTLCLFLFLFLFRLLFSFYASFNPFIPNFGDTELFSDIISNNSFYEQQSLGVRLYYYFSYPLRILSGFNLICFLIFQTSIYYISMLVIWRAYLESNLLNKINNKNKVFIIFSLLVTLYPAALMYISVPLREYLLVFAMSFFLLGLTRFLYRNNLSILALSIFLFLMVRPHLIPALIAIIYFSKYHKKLLSYIIAILLPPLLLYIFSLLFYTITPTELSKIRNSWASAHPTDVYGAFNWVTWLDILISLPSLLIQYILSPFPILHNRNPFSMLAGSLDAIFVIVIY
ncbi:hypothetical protein ACS7D9_11500 [Proteus mirabilis]|uniref:hypothetical protein n=1 Tax=Proteus mirabilis TaxID=584 RepID=UPI003F4394B3